VTSRNLIHLIICLSVIQSSIYVRLLAIGHKVGAGAPVRATVPHSTPAVDSVEQALTLTGVVAEATVSALLLALTSSGACGADAMVPVPLLVAIPLLVAAALVAVAPFPRIERRQVAEGAATAAATVAMGLCVELLVTSSRATIGISFTIDPLGAGLAALAGALVTAAFIYSWRYFDAAHNQFHVLMLVLLGAMAGFCLTGDIFDRFVFFELMGAAAFGLTAYTIEEQGPLQGALNFGVINMPTAAH
jgi:multisubunit Na+/H+ antiporter MnhC subunit